MVTALFLLYSATSLTLEDVSSIRKLHGTVDGIG